MNSKERIKLILDLVNKLSALEYPQIDLILSQYGFRTYEVWTGSMESYIQEVIKSEEDAKLIELYSYFDENFEVSDNSYNNKSWDDNSFCVFLSHLASDKIRTAKLQEILQREYNISCFVAHVDIEPGYEWQIEIEKALEGCDALVALLVPDFHKSNWTDQEIGYVMGRKKKIIAVRFGLDPYGFIGKFQGIQGAQKTIEQVATEIFNVLAIDNKTKKKITDAIVYKFENSSSFAEAKNNVGLLEGFSELSSKQIERIRFAEQNNNQINHSFGVSERVKSLLKKYT